jgi:membrane protein DedA with SNARE-associated domain
LIDLSVADQLLDWLVANGPQVLGAVTLLCALGIPLPLPVLVLASGALVREGLMDARSAVLFCYIGSMLAETIFYLIGRYAGPRVERRTGRFAALWMRAERHFEKHPALTVYLTRWLLVPLGIPTNLLAGSTRYPYWRFMLSAMVGDAMWIALYGLTGYMVGSGWRRISPYVVAYGGWIAVAAVTVVLLYGLWHYRAAIPALRWRIRPVSVSADGDRHRSHRA